MSRAELPSEVQGLRLDFEGLKGMLELLVGEEVVLDVASGDRGSAVSAFGELSFRDPVAGLPLFFVGSGCSMLLAAADFEHASLTTYEGTTYFALTFSFAGTTLTLGDSDLLGADYQGY